jgi:hypothetical protein
MTEYSLSKTVDDNIMIVGSVWWADEDYETKAHAVTVERDLYTEKYGELEMLKELKERSKASQADWKKVQAAIDTATMGIRNGVLMIKTNEDLNVSWAKVVKPERSITNYVLKATSDAGAIIGGEYETNVVKSILFGTKIYYKDGFLMKLDSSGNIKNDTSWITDYVKDIITEMMTPYVTSNSLTLETETYSPILTNRQPEFSLYKKTKTTIYAAFKSLKETLCPVKPKILSSDTPLQNSTSTSNLERTWPQINYEKAIPAETINEKSLTLHNEILPILNQLYDNQVKLTDNMSGSMLDYSFSRIVTPADKEAVKEYLVGLGYKIQDETEYQLTMYKVGYFLTITFSINNTNKGFLEITY